MDLCWQTVPNRNYMKGAIGGLGYPAHLPLMWLLPVCWVQERQRLKAGPEHRASCHIVFPYSWILAHICPQWVPKFFSLNQESESENEVAQSCPTLCDPMDCSLPGSSVHRLFQARVLEWVAISFSRGSSQPRDWTWVCHIVGKCLTIWATREPPESSLTRSSPEIENVTTYMLIFFKKNNLFIPSIIKHFIEI